MDKKTTIMSLGVVVGSYILATMAKYAIGASINKIFDKLVVGGTHMPLEGCVDEYGETEDGRKCINYFDKETGQLMFRAIL